MPARRRRAVAADHQVCTRARRPRCASDDGWPEVRARGRRACIARLGRCHADGDARSTGARAGRQAVGAARGSGGETRSPGFQQGVTRLRAWPRSRRSATRVRRDGSMTALRVRGRRQATRRVVGMRVRTHSHGGGGSGEAQACRPRSLAAREAHRARGVCSRRVAARARPPAWRRERARSVYSRDGLRRRRGQTARRCRGGERRRDGQRKRDAQHPGQQSHESRAPRVESRCGIAVWNRRVESGRCIGAKDRVPATARFDGFVRRTVRAVTASPRRRQLRPVRCSAYHAGVKVSGQNCQPCASPLLARVLHFSGDSLVSEHPARHPPREAVPSCLQADPPWLGSPHGGWCAHEAAAHRFPRPPGAAAAGR